MSFFSFQDIVSCVTGILIMVTLLLAVELAKRPQTLGRSAQASTPDWVALSEELKAAQKRRDDLTVALERTQATLTRDAQRLTFTPAILDDLRSRVAALRKNREERFADRQHAQGEQDDLARQVASAQSVRDTLAEKGRQLEQQAALERTRTRVTLLGGRADGKKPLLVEFSPSNVGVAEILPSGETRLVQRFDGETATGQFLKWTHARSSATEYFVLLVRPEGADVLHDTTEHLKMTGFDLGWDVWPKERSLFGQSQGR